MKFVLGIGGLFGMVENMRNGRRCVTYNLPYAMSKFVDQGGTILNSLDTITLGISCNVKHNRLLLQGTQRGTMFYFKKNCTIYRILYRTEPLGKMRMYTFGIIIL